MSSCCGVLQPLTPDGAVPWRGVAVRRLVQLMSLFYHDTEDTKHPLCQPGLCTKGQPSAPKAQIETQVTFVWYGQVVGDGLRSNGVDDLPPSTSRCSILPIARHLRAGVFWLTPTRPACRTSRRRILTLGAPVFTTLSCARTQAHLFGRLSRAWRP